MQDNIEARKWYEDLNVLKMKNHYLNRAHLGQNVILRQSYHIKRLLTELTDTDDKTIPMCTIEAFPIK